MTIAIICGMQTKSSILNNPPGCFVIQGRDADTKIEADLEAAISAGGIEAVMSVGVAGALAPDLKAGDIVVGVTVTDGPSFVTCDIAWKLALVEALMGTGFNVRFRAGAFGYSPGVVATSTAKAALRASLKASVVDMETWRAATVAARHGLPFAALRTVSDPAHFDLPPAALAAMTTAGSIDFGAVMASVEGDPEQIGALLKLQSYSATAFDNLAAALLQIGPGMAFPRAGT